MKLLKKDTADVISHDVTPLEVKTDAGAFNRIGWLVVLFGFGSFVLWALLAPLDKGVPLSGTVASESNRQSVQHQSGGTVQELLVRDGDVVKKGQVLVRMNPIVAESAVQATDVQYLSALATVARLTAERDSARAIKFPDELAKRRDDPRIGDLMSSQELLLLSRRGAIQNEISGIDASIEGLKMQITGLQQSRDSKKEQVTFIKEQLDGMRELAKEGYVARNRLLDLERTYAQLGGAISEDIGNIGRSQRQVVELTMRRAQRLQEYQKEIGGQLNDYQREAESQHARLVAQRFELTNVEVRAPAAGTVVGLAVFTNGGVVPPGFKMMDIVPSNAPLIIDGRLPTNLVDKVHAGLPVELIFSAFNTNKTPHIDGELTHISADSAVDEKTGVPYYKVHVKVAPAGEKKIIANNMDIRSGMPVELFVKTGERTMMSYLFKPIMDRAHTALSEE